VPKTIVSKSKDDEIEFQHAWKNHEWHCIEPVSFDLLEADSIKDKAHRWLGQISSVQDSAEPFKTLPIAGGASIGAIEASLCEGTNILNKMPGKKEFVREHESAAFASEVAGQIKRNDEETDSQAARRL